MKEAILYQKLKNKAIQCNVCQRRCKIADCGAGFCKTRVNKEGKLYTLIYEVVSSPGIDPIEKKPMYHFHPGTRVFSLSSYGCNFRCKQCLNSWCSYASPSSEMLEGLKKKKFPTDGPISIISSSKAVKLAKENNCLGIAFTYNEPSIWAEYVHDTTKIAQKEGLYTVMVTNGSWTKEALDYYGQYIDGANIDFKGFSQKTYARQGALFSQVPEMAVYAQEKHNIFLEITTLLIPSINDDENELKKMTSWMTTNLGPKTPWHLSAFDPLLSPDKDFRKIPFTTPEQLEKAAEIGRKSGLHFIYIWAPNSHYAKSNLVCPKCGTICVKRDGWRPEILAVDKKGRCSKCGEDLNLKL